MADGEFSGIGLLRQTTCEVVLQNTSLDTENWTPYILPTYLGGSSCSSNVGQSKTLFPLGQLHCR